MSSSNIKKVKNDCNDFSKQFVSEINTMQTTESLMKDNIKKEETCENSEKVNFEPSVFQQSIKIKKEYVEVEPDLVTCSDDSNLFIGPSPSRMVEFVEMKVVKTEDVDEFDKEEDPIKTNEGSFSDYCKIDTKSSSAAATVQNKKRRSTKEEEKVYQCDKCDNKFKSRSGLHGHLRRHSGIGLHTCNECQKQFLTPSALVLHSLTHTGEKPYKCTQCEAAFHHASNLNRHMLKHTVVRPNVCNECGQSYKHSVGLTTHMRIHTGERPYQCTQCSKAFTQSSDLNKHMRTHTGEKPYQCAVCSQAFSQSCNLRTHMKTHSNKTDSKT